LLPQLFLLRFNFLADVGQVFEGVATAEGNFVHFQTQFLDNLKGALGGRQKRVVMLEAVAGEIEQDFAGFLDGLGVLLFLEVGLGAVFRQEPQPGAQGERGQGPPGGARQMERDEFARIQLGGEAGRIGDEQGAPVFTGAGRAQFQSGAETFLQALVVVHPAGGLLQGRFAEPAVEEAAQSQQTGQRGRARQDGGGNGGELKRGQREEPYDRPGE